MVLDEGEVRLLFGVRAAVEQPKAARRVLQGAGVADEGGGVHGGRLPLAQGVVAVEV